MTRFSNDPFGWLLVAVFAAWGCVVGPVLLLVFEDSVAAKVGAAGAVFCVSALVAAFMFRAQRNRL